MIQADTEQLEILGQQLKKAASNCDDSWYLQRCILSEMDMDAELMATICASNIWEHMNEAVSSAELLNESMAGLASVLKDVPELYEKIGKAYITKVQQITEYMLGLSAMYNNLIITEHKEWIPEIRGEYLVPVQQVLKKHYQFSGVVGDES